jgi:methylphosphotriester-DNA--protein-cysteine methyltransferase
MYRDYKASSSSYYRFTFCDGLEALAVNNHKTPFPAHFHPTFNITLVYDGVFPTKLHDRLVIAPSGSILITNPQEIHANPFQKGWKTSFFTFYVSQDFLNYCNQGQPVHFEQKTIDDAVLFSEFHNLSVQLAANKDFEKLETDFRITLRNLASKYGSPKNETNVKLVLFQELLAGEQIEKFSLTEAAKSMGLDKYKFLRLFKDQTGLTPNNYFIYKRIEKSKEMLAEGRGLLNVAVDLGFYDAAHYANHFKKFTGVSPMNFSGGQ